MQCPARVDQIVVAGGEHHFVADALFGVDQQRLAGQRRAVPARLLVTVEENFAGLLAPFMLGPGAGEISLQQVASAPDSSGLSQSVGSSRTDSSIGRGGRRQMAQRSLRCCPDCSGPWRRSGRRRNRALGPRQGLVELVRAAPGWRRGSSAASCKSGLSSNGAVIILTAALELALPDTASCRDRTTTPDRWGIASAPGRASRATRQIRHASRAMTPSMRRLSRCCGLAGQDFVTSRRGLVRGCCLSYSATIRSKAGCLRLMKAGLQVDRGIALGCATSADPKWPVARVSVTIPTSAPQLPRSSARQSRAGRNSDPAPECGRAAPRACVALAQIAQHQGVFVAKIRPLLNCSARQIAS